MWRSQGSGVMAWLESYDLCSIPDVFRRGHHADLLQKSEHILLCPLLNQFTVGDTVNRYGVIVFLPRAKGIQGEV
jgi:hypothetical protein